MRSLARNFAEKRRFPRLEWNHPGSLQLEDALGVSFNIPVTIHSVAPEGLGLWFEAPLELPKFGKVVTTQFRVGQREFELPGRLAWVRQTAKGWYVGIRLMLELARSSMRQSYARWIVDQIGRDLTEPKGSVHDRSGRISGSPAGPRKPR